MSSFDPKGTAPGLTPSAGQPKVIHLKCKNENCKSVRAIEIVTAPTVEGMGATHSRLYQCVECKHSWPVTVGGGFANF